jgi:hypothetical protein
MSETPREKNSSPLWEVGTPAVKQDRPLHNALGNRLVRSVATEPVTVVLVEKPVLDGNP